MIKQSKVKVNPAAALLHSAKARNSTISDSIV